MIEGKGDERFLKNRDDRFWQLVRERAQASAEAGAENKRLSNKRARSRGQGGALYRIDSDPHAQSADPKRNTQCPVAHLQRNLFENWFSEKKELVPIKARLVARGEGRAHLRSRARPRW